MATGSFRIGIGVGSDSDSNTDLDPLSKSDAVDSAKSSLESSNSMEGITSFAFHQFASLEIEGGGVGRFDYWGCGGGGGADCS